MVASEILADAYFREGYQVQCFPSFGVERRGAPVTAFLRTAKEFIYVRSMIYQAHVGLVFSADIVQGPAFKPSLRSDAIVLINSDKKVTGLDDLDASYVDASAIALDCKLGSAAQPLVNTAMLGAYAQISGDLKLESLLAAVASKVPRNAESNLKAVQIAFDSVNDGE